ncbi:hypothetical protein Tco_1369820 [Tanacetum coccineum]
MAQLVLEKTVHILLGYLKQIRYHPDHNPEDVLSVSASYTLHSSASENEFKIVLLGSAYVNISAVDTYVLTKYTQPTPFSNLFLMKMMSDVNLCLVLGTRTSCCSRELWHSCCHNTEGCDCMQSHNLIIKTVSIGLGHNLFSVGQFCDSDLEVAFRKHTCFVRDLDGVDLIKGSSARLLVGINPTRYILRKRSAEWVVECRNRTLVEVLVNNADILPNALLVFFAPYVPPTNKELEILFQPMFDEYFETSTVDRLVPPALAAQAPVKSTGPSVSIPIDQEAPSGSHSPSRLYATRAIVSYGSAGIQSHLRAVDLTKGHGLPKGRSLPVGFHCFVGKTLGGAFLVKGH